MDTKDKEIFRSVNSGGKPLKSYKKTILGKVYVSILNSFDDQPEGLILQGDPRSDSDSCIVDIYTDREDFYFKSKNKIHLQTGTIIPYVRKEVERERTPEEFSDEELRDILAKPFFSTQKLINGTESVALLFRIKTLANDMDKSEKVMKAIEARISEVQMSEYSGMPEKLEAELN